MIGGIQRQLRAADPLVNLIILCLRPRIRGIFFDNILMVYIYRNRYRLVHENKKERKAPVTKRKPKKGWEIDINT